MFDLWLLVLPRFLVASQEDVLDEPHQGRQALIVAVASGIEGAEVVDAPRELDSLAASARDAQVLWLCNPGNPGGELWPPGEIVIA